MMESDLGEVETTIRLAEIYRRGKMVEEDEGESRRLVGIATRYVNNRQADGFDWGINLQAKTLFIKGKALKVFGE